MLSRIVGWFIGGGGSGIASQIRQAYKDRLDADNDEKRIKADQEMDLAARKVEAQTRGAGSWWAKFVRFSFAFPYICYINWLIIHDKMFELGATDPLSPILERILWTIVAFYFLDNTIRLIKK